MVTGNFDNWSQSDGVLTKDADSEPFEVLLKVPTRERLVFKFVVNGEWTTDSNYKLEHDEHGNPNNYVDADELIAVEEFTEELAEEPVAVAATTDAPKTADFEESASVDEPDHEKITQVLTSDSSYAAVSLPSTDSAFEHVSQEGDPPSNRNPRRRNAPEDLTPTNSSGVAAKQPQTTDSEVTTIGPNSRNSSFTGRPLPEETLKVPGAYPVDVDLPKKGRRDGLITRLKGLFR